MNDIELKIVFSSTTELGNYDMGEIISLKLQQILNKELMYKNGDLYIKKRYGRGGYYANYYKIIEIIPKMSSEVIYNYWRLMNE